MKSKYDAEESIKLQERYCKKNHVPFLIPRGGKCFSCGYNIFNEPYGFTVKHASAKHITGCPHCMTSFIE